MIIFIDVHQRVFADGILFLPTFQLPREVVCVCERKRQTDGQTQRDRQREKLSKNYITSLFVFNTLLKISHYVDGMLYIKKLKNIFNK